MLLKFLRKVESGLLRRHRAHDLVVSVDRREFRDRRDVQVKPTVAAADVAGGPRTFGIRHATTVVVIPFVVAPLVSAESLAGRKRLVADRADVRFPSSSSSSHGGCGCHRRRLIIASAGVSLRQAFPVARLVPAESLVRREGLVADAALVDRRR